MKLLHFISKIFIIIFLPSFSYAQQEDYRPKVFSEEKTITGTVHVSIECWNGIIVGFDCNESKSACGSESKVLPAAAEKACASVSPTPVPRRKGR